MGSVVSCDCVVNPWTIPVLFSRQSCSVVSSNESEVTLSKHTPFVQLISLINTVPTLRVICIFMSLSHDGVICQKQPK